MTEPTHENLVTETEAVSSTRDRFQPLFVAPISNKGDGRDAGADWGPKPTIGRTS